MKGEEQERDHRATFGGELLGHPRTLCSASRSAEAHALWDKIPSCVPLGAHCTGDRFLLRQVHKSCSSRCLQ